ncbi:TetR/AcrR family transcriptional regulator [Prescottella equi]|uniref:TetR/AcrR family transcriptional regulator n=1 Tax=Rhodococcus hoagii TaxID=43767 RepID=UPI003AFFC326
MQLGPILANALEAFHKNGFHGTSVRELARRVGVTVPALYYYYENKEAVLVTLLNTAVQDLIDRAQAAVAVGGDDPVLRFTNIVEAVVLNMTHRARQAALDSELRHVTPGNRRKYALTRKRVEVLATELVTDGVRSGAFVVDDVNEGVRALLGMGQSIARWYQPDGLLTPDQIANRHVTLALRIVGHSGSS